MGTAQPSNQASEAQFYEVSEDTADSTAPPGVTVVGQLRMQVSDPAKFAKDPAAMQAVKESIAKIAGVPVSAVKGVKMFPVSGASGMVQADFKIDVPADNASATASPTPGPENPCATTSAPENPCGTTQATGVLAKIFR